jgi:hypothetical protein
MQQYMEALLEVPIETTNVAPYMPIDLGKNTTEYLQDLRSKLETAGAYAEVHTKLAK